jgi:DNA polymerase (family X)
MSTPDVGLLLDIDREYREKAASGLLQKIAPRRYNSDHKPWLPVLHTRFGPWRFTALYSNTSRAHELNRTHDWVVICFDDDECNDGQFTVVTEWRGSLTGRRVVRGREPECAMHYRATERLSSEAVTAT